MNKEEKQKIKEAKKANDPKSKEGLFEVMTKMLRFDPDNIHLAKTQRVH